MLDRLWTRHSGIAAIGFGVIAAVIYVVMITVTLSHIEAVSGQLPFDMRPLGYSQQDAAALLSGLGVEGRSYYLTHQLPLDTAYPALLALNLVSLMRWFGQVMPNSVLVRVGIILSVGAALCDYCENLGIVVMILNWSDLSGFLVFACSFATVVKSVLTTMAVMLVLLIGVLAARHQAQRVA